MSCSSGVSDSEDSECSPPPPPPARTRRYSFKAVGWIIATAHQMIGKQELERLSPSLQEMSDSGSDAPLPPAHIEELDSHKLPVPEFSDSAASQDSQYVFEGSKIPAESWSSSCENFDAESVASTNSTTQLVESPGSKPAGRRKKDGEKFAERRHKSERKHREKNPDLLTLKRVKSEKVRTRSSNSDSEKAGSGKPPRKTRDHTQSLRRHRSSRQEDEPSEPVVAAVEEVHTLQIPETPSSRNSNLHCGSIGPDRHLSALNHRPPLHSMSTKHYPPDDTPPSSLMSLAKEGGKYQEKARRKSSKTKSSSEEHVHAKYDSVSDKDLRREMRRLKHPKKTFAEFIRPSSGRISGFSSRASTTSSRTSSRSSVRSSRRPSTALVLRSEARASARPGVSIRYTTARTWIYNYNYRRV